MPLFAGDVDVLVHGDVHGHNVLVDGGDVTGLLDWEGAHTAPADVELDMLLRWTAGADAFPESPDRPTSIAPGDCIELVTHVRAAYPELFAIPSLHARLEVRDAHWHLVQLLNDGDPSPTWARLRALLNGRSHLGALLA